MLTAKNKHMKRLIIDMDDVLADTGAKILQIFNKTNSEIEHYNYLCGRFYLILLR